MTDNEIMKNVRCCADHYCKNCSLQGKPNCQNMLFSFAWDTMYNQKAEIERLDIELKAMRGAANSYNAELETEKTEVIKDIAGYLETEIESSDKRISEFDTSDEERGYNKGLRVALAYVQEFAEGV